MSNVFVIDTQKQPLHPVHPGYARRLLKQGYETREYMLEKWGRRCAYCKKDGVPLQVEHMHPRAKNGGNRLGNLTLACESCNQSKGTRDIRDFLAKKPTVLKKILAQAQAPFKDAAAVNATRWLRFVCSKTVKRGRDSNGTHVPLTTDSLMMGAIPIPLGEKRNSILPSVATGHQSEKREKNGAELQTRCDEHP